jgi:hypothetical protein
MLFNNDNNNNLIEWNHLSRRNKFCLTKTTTTTTTTNF